MIGHSTFSRPWFETRCSPYSRWYLVMKTTIPSDGSYFAYATSRNTPQLDQNPAKFARAAQMQQQYVSFSCRGTCLGVSSDEPQVSFHPLIVDKDLVALISQQALKHTRSI